MKYAIGAVIGGALVAGAAVLVWVTPHMTPQQLVVAVSYAFILVLMLITLLAVLVSGLLALLQEEQPIEKYLRSRLDDE